MADVLCFDDEVDQLLGSVLEYLTDICLHRVDKVQTLALAEQMIREKRYDVLMLDIRILPEMRKGVPGYENMEWNRTGVRLIERIRSDKIGGATSPNVPILALTAVVNPPALKDIQRTGEEGGAFVLVIQKPPRLADIGEGIRVALLPRDATPDGR